METARSLRLMVLLLLLPSTLSVVSFGTEAPPVAFSQESGKVAVAIGGRPIATYVYRDNKIPRPYFAHVRAPGGVQVTRTHPPVEGKDPTDHATYHPGIWMAFGDIAGSDYWRNKAAVVHEEFAATPTGGPAKGTFAVHNSYRAEDEAAKVICSEVCRYTFLVRLSGYLLIWDSTFSSDGSAFTFGDQEEMGLGVRVATPITEKNGGLITNGNGLKTARKAWGESADWCDYSGAIGDKRVGITLMCDPANFRPSWFHARDYGLLLANPFGRKAFRKGETSEIVVKPGEKFRLRYGVLLHASPSDEKPDLKAAYADFLTLIGKR